jgi:SAM-dependent methyltransferase
MKKLILPIKNIFLLKRRKEVLKRGFLLSDNYKNLMMRYYDSSVDGQNSAELKTRNFCYRHFKKNVLLGAWRWLGVYEKRDLLCSVVLSPALNGLDLGGARGPISLSVSICDRLDKDIFGRKVTFHSLADIEDESLDFIWSSHVLEHVDSIERVIQEILSKLKKGGKFICHVPAYTCTRWRSGIHTYKDCSGDSSHKYTFYLSADPGIKNSEEHNTYLAIDSLVAKYLEIEEAEMVGDNSIFIVATK